MSKPLPQSLIKKRQLKRMPPKEKGKRRFLTVGLVIAAGIVSAMGTMVVYAAVMTSGPQIRPRQYQDPEMLLEHGNGWYHDPNEVKLDKAKKLLDEAYSKGKAPVHLRQKTELMSINLRAVVDKKKTDADLKKVPLETGAVGGKGNKPAGRAASEEEGASAAETE
jgi:hypothetical protein